MKTIIRLADKYGPFLFDGTEGNRFRICEIEPEINLGHVVVLDFSGVENMTDSFANACFGNLFHTLDFDFRGKVEFANCSQLVKEFILGAMNFAHARATR